MENRRNHVHLRTRHHHPSILGATLNFDPNTFTGLRSSYRNLAWYFAKQGTPLPDDLLGDDKPTLVAAQYRHDLAWLHDNGQHHPKRAP